MLHKLGGKIGFMSCQHAHDMTSGQPGGMSRAPRPCSKQYVCKASGCGVKGQGRPRHGEHVMPRPRCHFM